MKEFWTSIKLGTVPAPVRRVGFRGGFATLFVAYLVAFAPPDYNWIDLLNIIPGTVAGVLLYLSHGFQKDFLEPFPFSGRLGRFMTERYGETRSESFRSVAPKMEDWVRVEFRPEIHMRLFWAGLIGTILGFGGFWALFAYFKATVYNSYGGNFFLFFQLNIFVCGGFITAMAISEVLRYIIRPKKVPLPPLTIDSIRAFNEIYGKQGISTTLSFDEVYVNLVIYAKLANYFNYGYGNAEQIRFWQASLLYLHMCIQALDENAFTLRIRKIMHMLDEKELGLPGLSDGDVAGQEYIQGFVDYWEKAGFSIDAHPYLANVPKQWRPVWMASVPQEPAAGAKDQSNQSEPAPAGNQGGEERPEAQVIVSYGRQLDDDYIRSYIERLK